MTKAYSRFITVVFSLFLGGLLLWHIVLPDRDRSETENRTLAQLPQYSWSALKDGSFTKAVEDYFVDQFPLRDSWTGLKARTEQLIGKTRFKGVYLCGDTLIAQLETPDEAQVQKNLNYVQRFKELFDIPVQIGVIPSAAEIWKEKLPAGAESWDQRDLLAQSEIDFEGILAAHKDEPIYYRTDHHWTSLGAFYGANAILENWGMELLLREDFTPEIASDSFYGTLYSTSGIHFLEPDTMEYWVKEEGKTLTSWKDGQGVQAPLYDRSYLEAKDKYSSFLGGNQPLAVIRNEQLEGGEKLLLIRDSYSDALAPFLAERFAEVHLMDLRYYRMSAAQYVEENDIDRVLVLYSAQNFITEKNVVFLTQ